MVRKITVSILIIIFSFAIGYAIAWQLQNKRVEIINQDLKVIIQHLQDSLLEAELDSLNDFVIVSKLIEKNKLDEFEEVLWSRLETSLSHIKQHFSYDAYGYIVSSSSIDSYKKSLEYVQEKAELRGLTKLAETAKKIKNRLKAR